MPEIDPCFTIARSNARFTSPSVNGSSAPSTASRSFSANSAAGVPGCFSPRARHD